MVFLMFGLLRRHRWVVGLVRPRRRGPHASHGATWIHGGVVTNVCGSKGLAGQVYIFFTYLVMTRHDEVALLVV